MIIVHNLIILLFLCVFTLYYKILTNIISFDYKKVKHIIKEPLQVNKININDKIMINKIFIAILETDEKCKIDVLNEIMIDEIIKQMENNNVKYYTIIDYEKNNECLKPMINQQIIFDYLFFYFLLAFWSISTTIITIHIYYDYHLTVPNLNEKENCV